MTDFSAMTDFAQTPSQPLPPLRQAHQNLMLLNDLSACAGWGWFQGRIRRRLAALTAQVMEDETLTDAERTRALTEYRALKREVLQAPEDLRAGAERVLAAGAAAAGE